MFNRAAFNRTAFNRSVDIAANDINYNATMTANYGQTTRLTAYIKPVATVIQNMSKAVHLCAGNMPIVTGDTTVKNNTALTSIIITVGDGNAYAQSNVQLSRHYAAAVTADAQFNRLLHCAAGYYGGISIPATLSAVLSGAVNILTTDQEVAQFSFSGKIYANNLLIINDYVSLEADFTLVLKYSSVLKAKAEYKKNIALSIGYIATYYDNFQNGYATFKAYISSEKAAEYVFEIYCPLPAGATLVINSEDFTATLDGENVLYAQKGEWIFINRNTQIITLDITDFVNTENIEGRILYRDRYL